VHLIVQFISVILMQLYMLWLAKHTNPKFPVFRDMIDSPPVQVRVNYQVIVASS